MDELRATLGQPAARRVDARGEQALRRDPLFAIACDIDRALGADAADLRDNLQRILRQAIARNDGKAFGLCADCRHFRGNVRPSSRQPHHCALLEESLSEADSSLICVEQEDAEKPRAA